MLHEVIIYMKIEFLVQEWVYMCAVILLAQY